MAPRQPSVVDWLSLVGLTACWGTAFLFNELALEAFGADVIVGARITLGALVLVVYARITGTRLPRDWQAWIPMLVTALFGVIVPFFLTVWAQTLLPSTTTAVLMAVMPLMVMTLAHFFVPGERLSAAKLTGFAVGFSGIVLIIGPATGIPYGGGQLLACLAVLGAALSYSATSVYARLRSSADPIAMAAGMLLVATVFTAPLLAAAPPVPPAASLAVLSIAILGLFATGFASVLYFNVVAGPGPSFLSLVNYMVPAWGVLLGVTVLGERLSPGAMAGLGLILAGIAMSEFGHRWLLGRSNRGAHAHSKLSSV